MEPRTKHFKKRDAVLNCLRSTTSHPSAEWVHAQLKPEFPDISLGTVYRNLAMFKQQGVICSIGTVRGVERFDANTEPHVHFICSECDSVIDLPEMEIPASLSETASRCSGGCAQSCQLSFTGLCRECQNQIQEVTP